ncbi:MAG: hypothetical protein H6582_00965 [Crocinitomicaceae bacterium]|nr:hypothetical protein [Crocinitomicaceae bacterium]
MELAPNFEGLIPLFGGVIVLLMATGKIDAGLDWVNKYARIMKIIGPIMILVGLLQIIGLLW